MTRCTRLGSRRFAPLARVAWVAALLALCACATTGPPVAAPDAPATEVPAPAPEVPAPAEVRRTVTVTAGGDVMFGRYVWRTLTPSGGAAPFEHLAPILGAADVAIVNLETPLSDVDPDELVRSKRLPLRHLRFRAPSRYARVLAEAGVDVAVLANNHAEDCGLAGLAETRRALEDAGVAHVGASVDGDPHAPLRFDVDDVRVAVVAATTRRNRGTPKPGEAVPVAFGTTAELMATLPDRVRALRESGAADVVLVSLHWGGEFTDWPTGGQQRLARALVDAGATAVLGHHAHVLQPVEAYRDGLILYNMGNLVFDMARIEGRRGAAFALTLARDPGGSAWRADALVVHPTLTRPANSPPAPATGAEATAILSPLADQSRTRFATRLDRVGDRLVWRATPAVSRR